MGRDIDNKRDIKLEREKNRWRDKEIKRKKNRQKDAERGWDSKGDWERKRDRERQVVWSWKLSWVCTDHVKLMVTIAKFHYCESLLPAIDSHLTEWGDKMIEQLITFFVVFFVISGYLPIPSPMP